MKYGLPYKGGKTLIAEKLLKELPSGDRFVDLFGGGGAMSHCALLSGRYKQVLYNELATDVFTLFKRCMTGQEHGRYDWISREDFFKLKDSDPFVKFCWSFGNRGDSYIYGRHIEQYKKAMHYAVVYDSWAMMYELMPEVSDACKKAIAGITDIKTRRLVFQRAIPTKLKEIGDINLVNTHPLYKTVMRKNGREKTSIQSLQRLESLERLERLESLESVSDVITFTNGSYENYSYQPGDVVYCDPPYEGTEGYQVEGFDSQKFYDWCLSRSYDVYVSSYQLPSDFYLVAEFKKVQTIGDNKTITERLYCNHPQKKNEAKQLYLFDDWESL